jgi:hypothetical protein
MSSAESYQRQVEHALFCLCLYDPQYHELIRQAMFGAGPHPGGRASVLEGIAKFSKSEQKQQK